LGGNGGFDGVIKVDGHIIPEAFIEWIRILPYELRKERGIDSSASIFTGSEWELRPGLQTSSSLHIPHILLYPMK
jgi:hypothetical protein